MSRDEIFVTLSGYLQQMFEIPAEKITLEARLVDDLDLDSIDAVDLAVKAQELSGKKIRPEQFKSVRTVGDVVNSVHDLIAS
jgi:acyl carrier protein